jgi:two-component system sensor histidine kinase KdpD
MVTDLLDLSRIRSGTLPTEAQLIAAEDLVGALLRRLEPLGAEARVRARLPADGSLLVGSFDFVQALRALGNLVENALAHSTAPVDLEVRQESGELVFAVLDRGPGVPEGERDRIFEPFFTGRHSPVVGGGTGLGLPIARSLAEAQGGSVRYAPRVGGGSVFELRLPAAPVPMLP